MKVSCAFPAALDFPRDLRVPRREAGNRVIRVRPGGQMTC